MQFMRNRKNKILWSFIYFILLPYWMLKGISILIRAAFRGLKFSMRRRITFNYLILYSIVGLGTYLFMIMGFTVFEINEDNANLYLSVNELLDKYEEGRYNQQELEANMSQVAQLNNCGIQLYFEDQKLTLKSEKFKKYQYPSNLFGNLVVLIGDRLYTDQLKMDYVNMETNQLELVRMHILQPIKAYYKQMTTLSSMLLFCLGVGFLFIWFVGSIINRRILRPIYDMTKTAEKISIRNMEQELDVNEAKYELKDLAITLNTMLTRLRTDYNKQKRFVSDVSHELRTPISIINGYAAMLRRWGKQDEAILDESITAIIGETKSMQVLVENLLTLVRADNQTLKFKEELFDIHELTHEIVEDFKMINNKNQTITCNCQGLLEMKLDYQMTKQMIRIFADNAIKYTPENGTIELFCTQENNECVISIKDSGIGVDAKDLPYIFDRFYRSDESRTRETGGHGLGLSIAKAIVIGQGGRIKVKSKKDEGSEFTVVLPIAPL